MSDRTMHRPAALDAPRRRCGRPLFGAGQQQRDDACCTCAVLCARRVRDTSGQLRVRNRAPVQRSNRPSRDTGAVRSEALPSPDRPRVTAANDCGVEPPGVGHSGGRRHSVVCDRCSRIVRADLRQPTTRAWQQLTTHPPLATKRHSGGRVGRSGAEGAGWSPIYWQRDRARDADDFGNQTSFGPGLRRAALQRQRTDDDRPQRERADDEQLAPDVCSIVRIGRHRVECIDRVRQR